MKLSDLKPGDKFIFDKNSSLGICTFVNPRLELFIPALDDIMAEYVYISERFQLYGSPYDYTVIKVKEMPKLLSYDEHEKRPGTI
jgi:hypothetical protein